MDRRSFLKTSALGGTAAAATTLAAPAYAQGKRTLTMVTSWPRGFAVLDDAATYLNNMVNEMSDGSLTIDKKACRLLCAAPALLNKLPQQGNSGCQKDIRTDDAEIQSLRHGDHNHQHDGNAG